MAEFQFTMDINANYSDITAARQQMGFLNHQINQAVNGNHNLKLNSDAMHEAVLYTQALERAIAKVEQQGGDLNETIGREFDELRRAAGLAGTETNQLRRELERLEAAGNRGANGIKKISNAARIATQDIKRTSTQLDKLQMSLREGVGQTLAFGAISGITGAIAGAVQQVVLLDKVMTDISIVSGKANEEMEAYRDSAFETAKALGTTAKDFMGATLIYEQQGGEAAQYAEDLGKATVIAANVTGRSTEEMSEYLTATINGFKMFGEYGAEAGTKVVDVYSRLGAVSGSGLDEMAEALQRTATVAADSGYDFEEIAAGIATVSETTRRSPEVIGSAFKSILLSFSQLRKSSTEDLNKFSNKVEEAFKLSGVKGISVFDNGELRDAKDIMDDIGEKWYDLSKESQATISEAIAGKEQAETLRAFFNNQERYTELIGEAYDSAGTAANQQLVYMDSLEAHIDGVKNAWQKASAAIIDTDAFKGMLEQAERFLTVIGDQESAFSALGVALAPLVGIFGQLFGGKMVADWKRNSINANLADETMKRLEKEGQLTEKMREQLELAKSEQRIKANLGEQAAAAYTKNKEEIKNLNKELEHIQQLKSDLPNIVSDIENALGPQGTGGYEGIISSKVTAARNQAMLEAEAGLEGFRQAAQAAAQDVASISGRALDLAVDDQNSSIDGIKDSLRGIQQLIADTGTENTELLATYDRIQEAVDDTTLSYEELKAIIEEIPNDLQEIQDAQENILDSSDDELIQNAGDQGARDEIISQLGTDRSEEEIQEELRLAEIQNEQMEEGATKTAKWRKAVEGLSAAYGMATPAISAFQSAMEGTISTGEALQQSLQGIGSTMLAMPHPALKAAGGLALLVGTFADFRSESEKAKETNEDFIRSYMSLKETTSAGLQGLLDSGDTLKAFEGLDAETILTGSAIEGNAEGSQELKKTYLEMANKIAETSPELVKYYDIEGNAVIDLTADYNKALEERAAAVAKNSEMMLNNQAGFITEYSGTMTAATADMEEAQTKMEEARAKIERGQNRGDDSEIKEGLKDFQKYSTQLAEAQTSLQNAGGQIRDNIIQPIIDSNVELQKLAVNSPKLAGQVKTALSDMIPRDTVESMLQDGNKTGVESMLKNAEKFSKDLSIMNEKELGPFLEKLKEVDSLTKTSLLSDSEVTFDEFKEAVNESTNALDAMAGKVDLKPVDKEQVELMAELGDNLEEYRQAGEKAATSIIPTQGLEVISANMVAQADASKLQKKYIEEEMDSLRKKAKLQGEVLSESELEVQATKNAKEAHKEIFGTFKEKQEYLDKAVEKANEEAEAYESLAANLTEATKTVEGYNEVVTNNENAETAMDTLDELKNKMEEFGDAEPEDFAAFDKLKKEYPSIAKEIEKSNRGSLSAIEAIQRQEVNLAEIQRANRQAMVANNDKYFEEWQKNNMNVVNFAAENYGIDAANYKNMEEYKKALANLSADEFANLEIYKELASRHSAEKRTANEKGAAKSFNGYLQGNLDNALSGFSYLTSDSLTMAQKIQTGFLTIVDVIFNAIAAIANSINKLLETTISGLLDGVVGPAMDAYNQVAGLFGADKKEFKAGDSVRKFFKNNLYVEGSNFAEKYAQKNIKKNEETKKYVLDNIDNLDEKAYGSVASSVEKKKPVDSTGKGNNYEKALKAITPEESKNLGDNEKSDEDKKKAKEKKKNKKEEVEDLELELDRYYKLENQLSIIDDKFDQLSRTKEEAYGGKKISLMEAEQRTYAQQTKVLNTYVKALEKERQEKKNTLSSSGFNFSGTGEITNLNERLTALQNAANKKTKEAKEKAIERVKKLQEEASRYTELQFNMIPDKKQAIAEAKSTIKALEREKVEYKVELKIQKSEYLQEVRDTIKEINGESFDRLDENMVVSGQQIKSNLELYDYYKKQIAAVNKNAKLSDADRKELLNEYKSEMLNAAKEAKSAYEQLAEIQGQFIDQSSEMIDKAMDGFDKIQEKASSLADMYESIYGVRAYDKVGKMREVQLSAIDEQLKQANQLKLQMELYQTTLEEGTEEWESANEVIKGLGDTIQTQLIARVELLQSSFAEFKNNLLEYGDRSVFGSLGLDDFEEQMNRVLDKNDKWFNSFEKITKVGSLMAEVNKAIADTTDPATAEAYSAFKEKELQTMMAADKISADEFERTQKLWEIEQKKQAMEDRKNAKRVANLVRDQNGNFTYEYVRSQDDSESSSSAKDLADAQASLKEFDEEKVRNRADEILSIVKDTKSKISDIYDDTSLTEAERDALLKRTMEQAKDDIAELQKEMIQWSGYSMEDGIKELSTAFGQNKVSLESMGIEDGTASSLFSALEDGSLQVEDILSNNTEKFADVLKISSEEAANAISFLLKATGDESAMLTNEMLNLSNKWVSTTQDNLSSLKTEYQKTQEAIAQTTKTLDKVTGNLNSEIKATTSASKKATTQINKQRQAMEHARNVVTKTTTSYDKLTKELVGKSGSGGTLGAMVDLQKEMNKRLSPAMTKTTKAAEALRKKSNETAKMLNTMGGKANYAYKQHKLFDSKTITTANNNVKVFGERSDTSAKKVESLGKKSDESRKKIASLSTALAALPGLDSDKRYYYTKISSDGTTKSVSYKDKQKASDSLQFVGYFADGGPTGRWAGSSGNQTGAHAIVHENEWILKESDTKNFLDGMKIQREMLASNGGSVQALQSQIAAYSGASTNNNLEQQVVIQASFPNATNSKEIENAFSNLSLRAQTHAFNKNNRKR